MACVHNWAPAKFTIYDNPIGFVEAFGWGPQLSLWAAHALKLSSAPLWPDLNLDWRPFFEYIRCVCVFQV